MLLPPRNQGQPTTPQVAAWFQRWLFGGIRTLLRYFGHPLTWSLPEYPTLRLDLNCFRVCWTTSRIPLLFAQPQHIRSANRKLALNQDPSDRRAPLDPAAKKAGGLVLTGETFDRATREADRSASWQAHRHPRTAASVEALGRKARWFFDAPGRRRLPVWVAALLTLNGDGPPERRTPPSSKPEGTRAHLALSIY